MNLSRIKRNKDGCFTTISNVASRDKRLSLKAKGFLLTIMSLPESWDFSINGMTSIMPEGKKAIYAVIKELIDAGYCQRTRIYEKGKILCWVYTFDEQPSGFELLPQKVEVENLQVENLLVEKAPQLKKELIKDLKDKKPTQSANGTETSNPANSSPYQLLNSETKTALPSAVARPPFESQTRNPVNSSLELTLEKWLDEIAKNTGASSRHTLADSDKWEKVCMKAINDGKSLEKLIALTKSELIRTQDNPQYFSPNSVLKLLQIQTAVPQQTGIQQHSTQTSKFFH
jgi:hypothetical protein